MIRFLKCFVLIVFSNLVQKIVAIRGENYADIGKNKLNNDQMQILPEIMIVLRGSKKKDSSNAPSNNRKEKG